MLTLTSLARADRHMLLNAGNDVQRWWRLVYTVLTGMVELLRVGIMYDLFTVTDGDQILPLTPLLELQEGHFGLQEIC